MIEGEMGRESHGRAHRARHTATLLLAALIVSALSCTTILGYDDLEVRPDDGTGGSAEGGGTGTSCSSAEDCPGLDTDCQVRACTQGWCGFTDLVAGTPCSDAEGQVCDGFGNCVECVGDAQCDGERCFEFQCVPEHCADGQLSGDESDTDCGGSCPPCEDGEQCRDRSDCRSGVCSSDGRCAPCTGSADCDESAYCDGGICTDRRADGDVCTSDEQCESGHCPSEDRVCCESACQTTTCVACLQGKTGSPNGTCTAITAGTDPDAECPAQAPSTCGSSGEGCNGEALSPDCRLHPDGTVCSVSSCTNGVEQRPSTCDGGGNCIENGTASCSPYLCGTDRCLTDCSAGGHADCVTAYYCSSIDQCVSQKGLGDACGDAAECQSGFCVDDYCCGGACTDACFTCASVPGTCTARPCTCSEQYGAVSGYEECFNGASDCEFFTDQPTAQTCSQVCATAGGECLDGWNDGGANCTRSSPSGCSASYTTQICLCSAGCGTGPRCLPGETCSSGSCT